MRPRARGGGQTAAQRTAALSSTSGLCFVIPRPCSRLFKACSRPHARKCTRIEAAVGAPRDALQSQRLEPGPARQPVQALRSETNPPTLERKSVQHDEPTNSAS